MKKIYRKSLTTVKRKKEKDGKRMPHHKFPGGGGGGRETLFLPFLPFSHKSCEKILRQIEMHLEKDTFMSNNEGNSVRGCYSSFSNTEYDVQSSFINHPNRRRRHSLLTKTGGKFKGKVDSFPAKKRSSRKKDFFLSLCSASFLGCRKS